jgi:glycosyltransferase involved in cell wall biosynthesis
VISPVAYAGAIAGERAALPSVITFHSMLHGSALVLGASESLTSWSSRILFSAVSSVVAAQAVRWMPGKSVGILPNGIDAGFWRAHLADSVQSEGIHFVSAMRLSRKKRPLALVRAFAEACRFVAGSPRLRLTIAGDGPERGAVLRLAAELGVGDRVTLAGLLSRNDLRALYSRAHVFVLPSERESFGIAALEARAAGLPVVAMLATGARDFIVPTVNGLLARDPAEMARFMSRLAVEDALRNYIAHRNASEPPPYDWSAVVAEHRRFYEAATVLRDGRSRASQKQPGSASATK